MSLIFIGDIHQNWHHVEAGLAALPISPRAAVLLGDIECTLPLDQLAAPLLGRGIEVYLDPRQPRTRRGPRDVGQPRRARA